MQSAPDDQSFMRLAIARALDGVAQGQSPYGAAVVRGGVVLSCEHNAVLQRNDPTAHAEIQALRAACDRLASIDLAGCVVYATCEPCAMCFGACHWAHVARIVYGASIADSAALGFGDLRIASDTMRQLAQSGMEIAGGVLHDECLAIFHAWSKSGRSELY